jgi:hypothetical protein
LGNRFVNNRKHDRHCAGYLLKHECPRSARGHDRVRGEVQEFRSKDPCPFSVKGAPPIVDCQIATNVPPQFFHALPKRNRLGLRRWIALRESVQPANAPHVVGGLTARRQRPRRSAAEQRDELAPAK